MPRSQDHRYARPLGLCLILLAGCRQPAPPVTLAVPKVTVAHPVERETVDEEEFTGWMQASETVEVRARVRGHIQEVHFQDGDLVKQGQLLFELDPRPFQVAIDMAIAQSQALRRAKECCGKGRRQVSRVDHVR